MAKIWKGHRGGSTRGYNDECLKEEAAAERGDLKTSAADLGELKTSAAEFGQLKTSTAEFGRLKTSAAEMGQLKTSAAESRQLKTSLAEHGHLEASATERRQLKTSTAEFRQLKTSGTGFSSSFKSATLLQSHHCKSQSEDDYESDQPLDLSSSKSNTAWLYSQEEDGGEGSDERDSNASSSNQSPLSERSFSPGVQESPQRGKRLTRDERWMTDQGITAHISIANVIQSDMTELKQTVEGLVRQNKLTETQASELMHIRKRGKNKNAAKNSRKKKDAEIDDLKKAVKEADLKLKPVAEEEQDLRLALSHWEEKLATLTHFLLISHGMNPDKYKVVIYEDEVLFVLREAMAGHDFGLEC